MVGAVTVGRAQRHADGSTGLWHQRLPRPGCPPIRTAGSAKEKFWGGILNGIFPVPKSISVEAKEARQNRHRKCPVPLYPCCFKEDMAMRTIDFAPFYRATVGFDRLFDMLDNSARPDWPPYNIEKKSDNEYRISMAVAGFGPEEIELTQPV